MADSCRSAQAFPWLSLEDTGGWWVSSESSYALTSVCGDSVKPNSGEGSRGSFSTGFSVARLYESQVYWSCTLPKSSSLKYPGNMLVAFERSL